MCFICERNDMSSERWVRRFSVDETRKHAGGFTIYKITSVLFALSSPEAASVLCVWKRYSDVRTLHASVVALHAALHLTGKPPALPKPAYFSRFEEAVIGERARSIKLLLDFVAEHRLLFTSAECVTFLQSGYECDAEKRGGADESSPRPPQEHDAPVLTPVKLYEYESEAEEASSEHSHGHAHTDAPPPGEEDAGGAPSADSPDRPARPSPRQHGVSAERGVDNESTFHYYTHIVEQLLQQINNETDPEKIRRLKEKTDKYLSHAENIYNKHLSNHHKTIQEEAESVCVARLDMCELSRYRVLRAECGSLCLLSLATRACRSLEVLDKVVCGEAVLTPVLVRGAAYVSRAHAYVDAPHALYVITDHAPGGSLLRYLRAHTHTHTRARAALRDGDLSVEELVSSSQKLLLDVDSALSDEAVQARGESDARERRKAAAERGASERAIPPATIKTWAAQLLIAVEELHQAGVVLRELHLEQVLLGREGQARLRYPCCYASGAVTLARVCACARAGDALHVAPELHAAPDARAHPACDWWSYGALLYHLVCGVPLSSEHPCGFNSHTLLQFPAQAPLLLEAESLLTQLLTFDPEQRLGYKGAEEVKQHPYFRDVDFAALRAQCRYD